VPSLRGVEASISNWLVLNTPGGYCRPTVAWVTPGSVRTCSVSSSKNAVRASPS
jgi:hypothetical protein